MRPVADGSKAAAIDPPVHEISEHGVSPFLTEPIIQAKAPGAIRVSPDLQQRDLAMSAEIVGNIVNEASRAWKDDGFSKRKLDYSLRIDPGTNLIFGGSDCLRL